MGKLFGMENLANTLFLDLLTAFERDAENRQPEIWEQLIDYCKYSAAPVGRFMLAIHDENPSTYLPAETLCAALQIVNHIQDLKKTPSSCGASICLRNDEKTRRRKQRHISEFYDAAP